MIDLNLINDKLLSPIYKRNVFKRSKEQENALNELILEYIKA